MFSRRSDFGAELNRISIALQTADTARLDLTVSNPSQAGLAPDAAQTLAAIAAPEAMTYAPEPLGLRSARVAVTDFLAQQGTLADAEHIMLTASTSEAYGLLFKLLCDAGDEVLVPAPSYPLIEHLAQLEDVRIVRYPLRYDGEWHVDVHALRSQVTERTRALIVVSPNNPTGNYLKIEEHNALLALGLPIIADEVFAAYPLHITDHCVRCAADTSRGLVFSLGGLSKVAALPQTKVAWTLVGGEPTRVRQALERLETMADSYLSVSSHAQHALPSLLRASSSTRSRIQQRTQRNLQALQRIVTTEGTGTVLRVEGGWYAVMRVPAVMSDEAWVLDLLEHAHVYVQPGYFYDFESEGYLVLSLLTPETVFAQGAARIVQRVTEVASRGR
jgi:alanine-synthesizing transaminase